MPDKPTETYSPGEFHAVSQSFRQIFAAQSLKSNTDLRPLAGKSAELLAQTASFFQVWEKVLTSRPKDVIAAYTGIFSDQGTTTTKGILRPRFDIKTPDGGRGQIHVQEIASATLTDTGEQMVSLESAVRAKRTAVLGQWEQVSMRSTEKAATDKSKVIDALRDIAAQPVDRLTITFQSQRPEGYRPLMGVQIIRTLDGVTAHPFIWTGDIKSAIGSVDLLPGTIPALPGAPTGYEAPFPVMPEPQYHASPLGRMSEGLVRLITSRL